MTLFDRTTEAEKTGISINIARAGKKPLAYWAPEHEYWIIMLTVQLASLQSEKTPVQQIVLSN